MYSRLSQRCFRRNVSMPWDCSMTQIFVKTALQVLAIRKSHKLTTPPVRSSRVTYEGRARHQGHRSSSRRQCASITSKYTSHNVGTYQRPASDPLLRTCQSAASFRWDVWRAGERHGPANLREDSVYTSKTGDLRQDVNHVKV